MSKTMYLSHLEKLSLEHMIDQHGTEAVHAAVAAISRGEDSTTARDIHLNWSSCPRWDAVRNRLRFLRTTLWGNFADLRGDVNTVTKQLRSAGFNVTRHPYFYGGLLLRLSEDQ